MLCNILKQAPENAYLEIDPEPDRDLLVKVGVRRHQHVRRVEVGVVEYEPALRLENYEICVFLAHP